MRITDKEKKVIVTAIKGKDRVAEIYLFGSRTNDALKGGDIDLLVVSDKIDFSEKISILSIIKEKIGEQKIDIVLKKSEEARADAFVQKIIGTAINLTE